MASPPARTHHRQGDPVPDLDVVSSRPQSSAISERSIGRPGPRYERKFNPLVLGQNQTTADSGNAADPVVRDFYAGPHAENFLQIVPEVVLVSDAAITASMAWSDAMKKAMGEEDVVNTKFNCDGRFDALAHKLFANVPITGITVGYDIRDLSTAC
jgi:hypothetical protein